MGNLTFYRVLMLMQMMIIGAWCFFDKEWLVLLNVLALLITYNFYRYEKQRKNIP